METFKLILKNIFTKNNSIFFLIGSTAFLFKFLPSKKLSIILFLALIIINLLKKNIKLPFNYRSLLTHLNWIFIPLFIYSFVLEPDYIGLLMIAHFFSDTIARTARNHMKPFYFKLLPKDLNGTLFFVFSWFILALFYSFVFNGSLSKHFIIIFLLNAIILGYIENSFQILKFPDNFNINIFGSLSLFLSTALSYKLQIHGTSLIFGLFICLIFTFLLIIFDIIKLKMAFKYYPLFVLLYAGFNYGLFLFHVLVLTGMALIKKFNQQHIPTFDYNHSFLEIKEIQEYFLLSFVLVFIYVFIPERGMESDALRRIIKMSICVGLIASFLHYLDYILNFFHRKNYYTVSLNLRRSGILWRLTQKLSFSFNLKRKTFMLSLNAVLSLLFLYIAFLLNILPFVSLIYAFFIINIFLSVFIFEQVPVIKSMDEKLIKYLVPFFSFKIFFLMQFL